MRQEFYKDVSVTSKGQLTLPVRIRKTLKLNATRKVRVAMAEDGLITLRPLPEVMSLYGSLKEDVPYDPNEKQKAREMMGRAPSRKR